MISGKRSVLDGNAMVLTSVFRQGYSFTKVIDRHGTIVLEGTPEDVLDATLRHYGSSLRGAKEGARAILGKKVEMPPIVVSEKLDIYYFQTASATNERRMWFDFYHITYFEASGENTKVWLSDGSYVIAEVSVQVFEFRYNRVCRLRSEIQKRTRRMKEQVFGKAEPVEEPGRKSYLNYTILINRDDPKKNGMKVNKI